MTEALQPVANRSLHAKLAEVMAEVGRVPKRGRNEFHKYDYATEADIVEAVRGVLSERKVTLIPSVKQVAREGTLTTVLMSFTFVDAETGETCESDWAGTGDDKGDKGLYKALTGALKYFLLKTFLMPTGDDPEADEATDRRAAGETKRKSPKSAAMTQAEHDEAWGRPPAESVAPNPPPEDSDPAYWRKRCFAMMKKAGWTSEDHGRPERMRFYSQALGRMIVTEEHAKAMTAEDWRSVYVALQKQSEPPGGA